MKWVYSIAKYFWVLVAGITLFLSGCGQPVCISGFGQCEMLARNNKPVETPRPLTMTSPSSRVLIGESMNFVANGGKEPYVYSIVAGAGAIDAKTGSYTAPSAPTNVTIRVTDANGNKYNLAIIVESTSTQSPFH